MPSTLPTCRPKPFPARQSDPELGLSGHLLIYDVSHVIVDDGTVDLGKVTAALLTPLTCLVPRRPRVVDVVAASPRHCVAARAVAQRQSWSTESNS